MGLFGLPGSSSVPNEQGQAARGTATQRRISLSGAHGAAATELAQAPEKQFNR